MKRWAPLCCARHPKLALEEGNAFRSYQLITAPLPACFSQVEALQLVCWPNTSRSCTHLPLPQAKPWPPVLLLLSLPPLAGRRPLRVCQLARRGPPAGRQRSIPATDRRENVNIWPATGAKADRPGQSGMGVTALTVCSTGYN